jgi:hypothetical protein
MPEMRGRPSLALGKGHVQGGSHAAAAIATGCGARPGIGRTALRPRTESEAIYAIRRTERRRRWSAQVTATVGTIPIAFYLLRRDAQPFSIFPPPCVDGVAAHPNFCRIAVGLIAARSRRLIGHKPSRVELLVQRQIGARMRPMFLRVCRLACCHDKKRNEVPQGGVLP